MGRYIGTGTACTTPGAVGGRRPPKQSSNE